MTTTDAALPAGRLRNIATAVWGGVSGVAPHVLHHVGPLAGAALLAGTGGKLIFFLIGLAVATPMLVRLYRRFHTWTAPAVAITVFALTYTLSSLYLGPLITGETDTPPEPQSVTTTTDEHGH